MQSPIPAGSVLQNRYRISRVLGQGGFGRTYLAEDQGRFNELCALKEFIPIQTGAYAIDKSKELFQREAAILYQIQHPQIPQFRATFEENQRLFLVQDYVEGKTYRELLNDRKAAGSTFSEAEVLQLVQQLLPVLAHIHARGIIHRDIAPDNIMLRRRDHLPVLIDFGVVKEIVTRVQSLETVPQHTTVGKLGYAPSEQMQTGNAFPSSDLYALAVTCLVLLTGREPNQMYDDRTFSWNWRPYATVSPGFGQILDRMLNYRPDQRYQNVSELAQALQALTNPAATPPTIAPPAAPQPLPTPTPTPPTVGSQMATVAVGRRPDPNPPTQQAPRSLDPIVPTPAPSIWENPLAVFMIGLGLAIVTLIGAYAVVSGVRTSDRTTPTPTPSATITPTPSPTPTASPTPSEFTQALNLTAGDSTNVNGALRSNETANFVVTGQQNEVLTAAIQGEGVLMTVIAPDGSPAGENSDRVQRWSGPLDFTGDYTIRLQPVRGVEQSDYRLSVSLDPAPDPSPTPTPTPSPEPEPQIDTTQLNVVPGDQGVQISNRVDPLLVRRYLVNVQEGQILSAELVEPGQASLNIRYPNGDLVEDASNIGFWQGSTSETGRYIVEVIADRETNFTLGVTVTDPANAQPQ
ncbi:serine/threonine protein kinase [Microcoleus sp. FACHB-1515]|uniref:serine/threonine-protein kinase n=1 Tax=Cyanophyceae TaxID=3028117 RepID=UPI001688F560|nr:serine/threonine-protein kinase [Microcoleus sp. FACHB-1515]MBD2092643.1 serine/threonine protein kinase [Microcoleus sp. FACHB-1515]